MSRKKDLTKESIIADVLAYAKKLGHAPSVSDLERNTNITRHDMIRYFGSYGETLQVCGLKRTGSGIKADTKDLLMDWVKIVREHKRIPRLHEYERCGLYSQVPFRKRFGIWCNVPRAVKRYALENGLLDEWKDVIELIDSRPKSKKDMKPEIWGQPKSKILSDRPVYGRLLRPCPLICAPVNEAGVIFLFGALAERLGFQLLRIQAGFPDAEGLRTMSENRLQRVKIEFEFESRNFLYHGHDSTLCDLIICWEDNWPESPLEVIELRKAFS